MSNLSAFQTAFMLNPNKSIDFLFELLGSKLNLGYKRVFSANLFNALSSVGYNTSLLEKAWLSMYEIIELRLPSRETYEWDKVLSNELNMNIDEIHICLLFCRFKSFTVQKFHIVLSSISILLYEDSKKLINPIKWFISNYEHFNKSIILVVLELLVLYEEENNGYFKNFESELKIIYPTDYFLIDYIIEDIFNLPIRSKLHLNNELIYPIAEEEVDFLFGLNHRHRILEIIGLDIKNILGKFKAKFSGINREYLDLYYNRMHGSSVNNIYFSDYLLKLINEDYYNKFKSFANSYQVYDNIKIDIKSIIAQNLSLSVRPNELKKYSDYDEIASYSLEVSVNEGWVRIAHYECELIEQELYKLKDYKTFGGITFNAENKSIFPFSGYRLDMATVWEEYRHDYEFEDTIVFSFIQKQFQIEDFKILWLNPVIVERLNLKVCDFLSGLYAQNDDNEIVLKFNSWYSQYLATDYSKDISHEIPKLDGSELLIREDYFNKICEMFDSKPKYCIFKTF
ncbi:MAG: hypothetical protein IPK03_01715 [Bacteroidetes bacterium]|nr:hypothetical protein [Bacteroidota bacterium]